MTQYIDLFNGDVPGGLNAGQGLYPGQSFTSRSINLVSEYAFDPALPTTVEVSWVYNNEHYDHSGMTVTSAYSSPSSSFTVSGTVNVYPLAGGRLGIPPGFMQPLPCWMYVTATQGTKEVVIGGNFTRKFGPSISSGFGWWGQLNDITGLPPGQGFNVFTTNGYFGWQYVYNGFPISASATDVGGTGTSKITGFSWGDQGQNPVVFSGDLGTSIPMKLDAVAQNGYSMTRQLQLSFHRIGAGQPEFGGATMDENGNPIDFSDTKTINVSTVEDPQIRPPTQTTFSNVIGNAVTGVLGTSNTMTGGFTGQRMAVLTCTGTNVPGDSTASAVLGWYVQGSFVPAVNGVATAWISPGQTLQPYVKTPLWNRRLPRSEHSRTFTITMYKGGGTVGWTTTFKAIAYTPNLGPNISNQLFGACDIGGTQDITLSASITGLSIAGDSTSATSYIRVESPAGYYAELFNSAILASGPIVPYTNGNSIMVRVTRPVGYVKTAVYKITYGCDAGDMTNPGAGSITVTMTTRSKDSVPDVFTLNDNLTAEPGQPYSQVVALTGFDDTINCTLSPVSPSGWTTAITPSSIVAGQSVILTVIPKLRDYLVSKLFTLTLNPVGGGTITTKSFTVKERAKIVSFTVPIPMTTNATPNDSVYSEGIVLVGFDDEITLSASSGVTEVQKKTNGVWNKFTLPALVQPGTEVRLKTTTSSTYSATKYVALFNATASDVIGTWVIENAPPPGGGAFSNIIDAEPGQTYTLTSTPVTGFPGTLQYSIAPSTGTDGWSIVGSGLIRAGDSIVVAVTPPIDHFSESKTFTVTTTPPTGSPGATNSVAFVVTTRVAEPEIAPVTFAASIDQIPGNEIYSAYVTLGGSNPAAGFDLIQTITCENGDIQVGTGTRASTKSVKSGDVIRLYTTAPMDFSESKTVTLRQGVTVLGTWTITNKVCDDLALLMDF